jgi:phosphatidylglycerophosphate synthase
MADRSGAVTELIARRRLAGELVAGLACQVGLLWLLAATVGLSAAGWLTGIGFALVMCTLLGAGLIRSRTSALGPADTVTLVRAVLVGAVAALVADSLLAPIPARFVIPLTMTALLLDAVDGQVARRTGTTSALGARFDMEVDAFLILVLSVDQVRPLGLWVVSIGAMRYVFMLAGRMLPWLNAALPPRYSRKVVAALQGIVLVAAAAQALPFWLTASSVAVALGALCWSFGRDIVWLRRHAHRRTVGTSAPVYAAEERRRVAA